MNGYECNGTDIFMRLEMGCSIQRVRKKSPSVVQKNNP